MTSVCEFKSINELKCSQEYLPTLLGGYGHMAQLHITVIRIKGYVLTVMPIQRGGVNEPY